MTKPGAEISLLSRPMLAVLSAQFLSAFADNALLVAAIAVLKQQNSAGLAPLLQECFVVPFILLAPFVGSLADALPKGRVMFLSNALKLAGSGFMIMGVNPLLSYAMAGIGAAAYSPAKYGILPQLFGPEKLVKANSLLEGSTIIAILLGVLAGGMISDRSVDAALCFVFLCYGLAAMVNLMIPKLSPERKEIVLRSLLPDFFAAFLRLVRNGDARFTLVGTSLFWGTGATLRIALFAWVPAALSISGNKTPGLLMGVVSVGIVLGAMAAAAWVRIEQVNRVLLAGIAIGPLVIVLSHVDSESQAMILLALVGFCGGLFAVPLNALLQEKGHELIGAGRALAVQNFFENIAIAAMVGIYAATEGAGFAEKASVAIFGLFILAGMILVTVLRFRLWKT
ncbi:MAG: lysophospholipid transporter LplT [Burkholderiales bacterium]